jgi:4-diphosphocytidyl-2-C-methyl-D-erythritol kinase
MTTQTVHLRAQAKINWDLRILGKRADTFHELDSVFVTIGLSDVLSVDSADALTMTCSDPSLPVDASNLVMKAATLLRANAGISRGAKIHLEKHIPMGGGLGGGSSDAACALEALNRLWELKWDVTRLAAVAAQVGSDVAYFLYSGWCLCRGRGEIVQRLPDSESWAPTKLLLILPPLHVATPLVYKALGAPKWDGTGGREAVSVAAKLSAELKPSAVIGLDLRNDLTPAALQVEPRLVAIQQVLQNFFPGRWLMSGSGASHFAVPEKSGAFEKMDELIERLRDAVPATRVIETETIPHGTTIAGA